jgi:hypothetical protein
MASVAAGCQHCQAHGAHTLHLMGKHAGQAHEQRRKHPRSTDRDRIEYWEHGPDDGWNAE